jgi:nucleoside-diphosphate-sugar epimerase
MDYCCPSHGLGWQAKIPLRDGLSAAYAWFVAQTDQTGDRPRF